MGRGYNCNIIFFVCGFKYRHRIFWFLFDVEITLVPPNDGNQSDEDSDQEDGENINHLPGGILYAPAEFKATRNREIIRNDIDSDEIDSG